VGIEPARSAYVGDNPIRDVEGTRNAGYGMIIILYDPLRPPKETPPEGCQPDRIISNCSDLLDIFPPRR
jgi:FMN phosphatase YigB (HAD superfamily)